jgi:glycerol-3-phosphate dehydrogenase subunit B
MVPPADLETREDGLLLFVGLKGYPDFNGKAAAKAYLRNRMINQRPPKKIAFCEIELAPFGKSFNVSGSEIARHLDHSGSVDVLIEQLTTHAQKFGANSVAIPPVLGIRRALENKAFIEKETGLQLFELLGLPPSVPGLRLQKSLESIFLKSGGRILQGHEAVGYSDDKGLITGIMTKGPSRELEVKAKVFVLATGKFIGGGLSGDRHGLKETVLNLMTVTGEFYSAERVTPARTTSRFAISPLGQPLFSGGLSVDPLLRPVEKNGLERAQNLFCAGSIMAGYNYSTEKTGLGVAATTGYTAASNVIGYLEEAA